MGELAHLFDANPPGPVVFEGQLVSRVLRLPIEEDVLLKLRPRSFVKRPRQAISLSVHGASATVNGYEGRKFIFWAGKFRADGRPATVEVQAVAKGAYVNVWNSWESPSGRVDAWLMDSGMIVEQTSDHAFIAHCSDGVGDPDFGNLVFDVWLEAQARMAPRSRPTYPHQPPPREDGAGSFGAWCTLHSLPLLPEGGGGSSITRPRFSSGTP